MGLLFFNPSARMRVRTTLVCACALFSFAPLSAFAEEHGKPTFALGADGTPKWKLKKTCDQVFIGKMMQDGKSQVLCDEGRVEMLNVWAGGAGPTKAK